jgi:hypothetical protein
MSTNGIRDLAALTADDDQAEWIVNHLPDEELLDLAAYAAEWDADAKAKEWRLKRRPRLPRWFFPVNGALLVIIAVALLAWGV